MIGAGFPQYPAENPRRSMRRREKPNHVAPGKAVAVGRAGAQGGGMGFFDDAPAPVPEPLWRHHHPWDPPEAEFPGIVPIDATLLGRTDQAAVAITGLAAFSNGFEIQLTARSRPSEGDDARPGPGRAGRSLR